MSEEFARRLLAWYATNARQLPWRGQADAYAVWVSEIMLQQTRVETVLPYFERWMQRFPTLTALCAASQQEVLSAWEGLGYYSRARNLQRAAQRVAAEYGGRLPEEAGELQKLPGIGRYTAAAIASMAFGKDEAALDGNIKRVLARVFDVEQPAASPGGQRRLWQLAAEHLPPGKAGDYNQALMDLGATLCTPREPACPTCPLAGLCLAYRRGVQAQRPVTAQKPPIPHYEVTAAVIHRDGRVLIARRPPNGLLGGLWEFPGGKQQVEESLEECLKREICEELGVEVGVREPLGVYRHAYTHFSVRLHAFHCALVEGEPQALHATEIRWVGKGELGAYPMGKLDRQIARRLEAET